MAWGRGVWSPLFGLAPGGEGACKSPWLQAMERGGASLIEVPIGPGLEFVHRRTQSQAVVPAYRGSSGRGAPLGAGLAPPPSRKMPFTNDYAGRMVGGIMAPCESRHRWRFG